MFLTGESPDLLKKIRVHKKNIPVKRGKTLKKGIWAEFFIS
jgi:hypothetical protein